MLTVEFSCWPATPVRGDDNIVTTRKGRPRSGRPVRCSDWLDRPGTLPPSVCVEGHEIFDAGYVLLILAVRAFN